MSFRYLFGDDRSIYALSFSGALLWYGDLLRDGSNGLDGERGWDSNSGNQIHTGWNGFEHVFAGGGGIIYAIRESGELLWYQDLLRDGSNGANGESGWASNSGNQIGSGWNGLAHVFSGGDGIIYAIRQSGELLWYQDLLRDGEGESGWAPGSGNQIGIGWIGFEHVFSGDNGIIYTIGNADLRWYQDLLRDGSNGANGESGWAANSGNLIGGAWGDIQNAFSGGGGVIYGIENNDLFWSLDKRQDGEEGSWVAPETRIGIERRFTIGASPFLMIRGTDNLHFGLSWWGFRLELGAAALASRPRLVARSDEATVTLTFPPQILSEPAMMPGDRLPLETHRALPSSVQFSVRVGTPIELNPESVLTVLGSVATIVPSGPLGEQTTVLEIPWHLLVTVAPRADGEAPKADHVAVPVTSPAGVTGLWHTRLLAGDGDDTDARLWLVPIEVVSDEGIRTPLTVADRVKILGETTNGNGFPQLRRLELSALGGSLSLGARWPDFEWDHDIIMGRDQHVRTLMTGMLYPFGLGAVTTTITERVFPPDPPPAPSIAALISNATLLITEPVRAVFDRGFPFREVEILARRYEIDPPQAHPFVPTFNGQPLMFPVRCAGASGDVILQTPLVFVDDPSAEADAAEALWDQYSTITLPGVPIDLVGAGADRRPGDVHEVHEIRIAPVLDADGVHPTLDQFKVALPALRALMANTASDTAAVALKYAPEFLNAGSTPDLAFVPAEAVRIDFSDRPDRSGGLMAPRFAADRISRTLGPVPQGALTGGIALTDIYAGATLLGLPLGDVLDAAALPGAPTIVPLTNPTGAKMSWENLALKDCGPLKTTAATKATLTVEKSAEKSEITGRVENFQLLVPELPAETLVTLTFAALTFTQIGGQAPDLTVDGLDMKFGGELQLVQMLLDKLLPLLRGTAGSGRSPALDRADVAAGGSGLTIRTDQTGLTASFSAGIDEVPAGIFQMRNIAAHFGAVIPFSRDPITVSLGFASHDNPFSLSVLTFGGGGYVDATLGGLTHLEASMDFGAVVTVDFLVVSAEVHALGGVHFLQNGKSVTFEAFIRLGGSVEVLGVVSISVDLLVTLQYASTGNKLVGHATLVVEVDLTLFSQSVTLDSGSWVLAGSQDAFSPFRRASLDDGLANLLEYYEAFAT